MRGGPKCLSLLLVTSALAACATAYERPLPQPPDGYDAVRFRQLVEVPYRWVYSYRFEAGKTLLSDREIPEYPKVFCGMIEVVNSGQAISRCIAVEGNTLVLSPGYQEERRPLPPGAIEIIKQKL